MITSSSIEASTPVTARRAPCGCVVGLVNDTAVVCPTYLSIVDLLRDAYPDDDSKAIEQLEGLLARHEQRAGL